MPMPLPVLEESSCCLAGGVTKESEAMERPRFDSSLEVEVNRGFSVPAILRLWACGEN